MKFWPNQKEKYRLFIGWKPNRIKIAGFLSILAALWGCFFHSLIISHVTIKVQVFSLPMLYLKHKEDREQEKNKTSQN